MEEELCNIRQGDQDLYHNVLLR
uniref:Uncharacterized protein n=1 Tax=Nymphaea colorata TaxID=210225 RepID=A0A5K1ESR9_9MAGN|nr:unnamed protein product [Nymphaea colorata]